MIFRPTTETDHPAIADLLTRSFRMRPGNLFHSLPHQRWKYWQPRADWTGPRSYVFENEGKLLAHGCVWPMPVEGPERRWNAIYLIDWGTDPSAPAGTGIALLRRIAALTDAICAIGGSEMTRAIMPKIGFRSYNDFSMAARPLRPLRQFATHQNRGWKLPARVVRNALWSAWPRSTAPRGWKAVACRPDEIPESLWPQPDAALATPERTAVLFAYLAESPWAQYAQFRLERDGVPAGYLCLSFAAGQARVADVWLPSRDPDDWRVAYVLAIAEARRLWSDAAEIVASCSVAWGLEGLTRAGFRVIARDPITFYGLNGFPGNSSSFHLQMIDADFSFLHTGEIEYRT